MSAFIERLIAMLRRLAASRFATHHAPRIAEALRNYAQLIRLERPIGWLLLLWPALWALWLSSVGRPNERVFIVFVLGVFLTRSAGCAFNDVIDRDFDPHVERTKDRPLAAKRIRPSEALAVFAALSLLALWLVITLNALTQKLALAGAAMMVTYPFFKRFFPAPQLYLGIAFSWSIPMAYAAQTGHVSRLGWLLFIAGILWTAVYDTMYAMVDRDDDIKIGVKSTAILFGDSDRLIVGIMQACTLLALWLIGRDLQLHAWFNGGLCVALALAGYQQYLIRNRERDGCLRAFANNNYFGMAIFLGIALDYIFRR